MLVISLLSILVWPPGAQAWGQKAHRIIAAAAEAQLDNETRRGVHALVGPEGLSAVASWADEIRSARPETAPWHYVNIPSDGRAYDPQRHCDLPRGGDCVVAVIERFGLVLSDRTQPHLVRAEALRFVTHFVADIHQPLHCLADFRGGNQLGVRFMGQMENSYSGVPWNLHAVWDAGLLEQSGLSEEAYVRRVSAWIASHRANVIQSSRPDEWAMESHGLALEILSSLPSTRDLDLAYLQRVGPLVNQQLGRAALRLARYLQKALTQP